MSSVTRWVARGPAHVRPAASRRRHVDYHECVAPCADGQRRIATVHGVCEGVRPGLLTRDSASEDRGDREHYDYRLHFFFFQAEDGIRDYKVTGVQTCALPI